MADFSCSSPPVQSLPMPSPVSAPAPAAGPVRSEIACISCRKSKKRCMLAASVDSSFSLGPLACQRCLALGESCQYPSAAEIAAGRERKKRKSGVVADPNTKRNRAKRELSSSSPVSVTFDPPPPLSHPTVAGQSVLLAFHRHDFLSHFIDWEYEQFETLSRSIVGRSFHTARLGSFCSRFFQPQQRIHFMLCMLSSLTTDDPLTFQYFVRSGIQSRSSLLDALPYRSALLEWANFSTMTLHYSFSSTPIESVDYIDEPNEPPAICTEFADRAVEIYHFWRRSQVKQLKDQLSDYWADLQRIHSLSYACPDCPESARAAASTPSSMSTASKAESDSIGDSLTSEFNCLSFSVSDSNSAESTSLNLDNEVNDAHSVESSLFSSSSVRCTSVPPIPPVSRFSSESEPDSHSIHSSFTPSTSVSNSAIHSSPTAILPCRLVINRGMEAILGIDQSQVAAQVRSLGLSVLGSWFRPDSFYSLKYTQARYMMNCARARLDPFESPGIIVDRFGHERLFRCSTRSLTDPKTGMSSFRQRFQPP